MTQRSIFTYSFSWENITAEPSAQVSSKVDIWNSNSLHERHHQRESNGREEQWIDNLAKHLLSDLLQLLSDISVLVGGTFSQVCDCGNVNWSTDQTENVNCLMRNRSRGFHVHLCNHGMFSIYYCSLWNRNGCSVCVAEAFFRSV